MKKLRIVLPFVLLFSGLMTVNACEINFKIQDDKKQAYAIGDVLIVEVEVVFTHRTCPVALKETKFKYQGVKILGATDWKQISGMKYTRKLKVQLTALKKGKKGKSQIFAVRTCDKEGGYGNIEIETL
ncbi:MULTISPECIES: hypothetical protein [unclassified Saccharicrinis]|uniref:hypothetical protein n=1 Tax=unclassified Saccharicrinis TaxID=2646859 RepID=UPI003D34553F